MRQLSKTDLQFHNLVFKLFLPILQIESEEEEKENDIKDQKNSCTRLFEYFKYNKNYPRLLNQSDELKSKHLVSGFSWQYAVTLITCTGIGIYSGWLFWNTSKAAADIIYDQLQFLGDNLSLLISELTKYCGVETNSVLNTQVMILMANMIRNLKNRSKEESFLTGKIRYKPWLVGSITAIGAALPFISLNISTAKGQTNKMIAYSTAIAGIPPYWFGSQSLLSSLFPSTFSKTIDNSEFKFSKSHKKLLQAAKSIKRKICLCQKRTKTITANCRKSRSALP